MQPGVLDKVVDYFMFKPAFCFLQLWQYHNQFTAELPSVFSERVLLTEGEGKLESPLANILNCWHLPPCPTQLRVCPFKHLASIKTRCCFYCLFFGHVAFSEPMFLSQASLSAEECRDKSHVSMSCGEQQAALAAELTVLIQSEQQSLGGQWARAGASLLTMLSHSEFRKSVSLCLITLWYILCAA